MEESLNNFLKGNVNIERVLRLLKLIAEIRYVSFQQLKLFNEHTFIRFIATKNNLNWLVANGYINENPSKVYSITGPGISLLKTNGINTKYISTRLRGVFDYHQEMISSLLLPKMFEPDYYAVFYPIFKKPPEYVEVFLIPDYCLIRKKENAYKIEFGEVEISPKQDGYIDEKKRKYERIAKDGNTYFKWWKYHCEQLSLPMCAVEEFCFNIVCYGGINYGWEGWRFEEYWS